MLALSGCAGAPEKAAEGDAAAGQAADSGDAQGDGGENTAPAGEGGDQQAAAGDAEQATQTAAAEPPPAKPDISTSEVSTVIESMKHHPRVLWDSSANAYRFYVGTIVFAEYNPSNDTFTVRTDNADLNNLVCTHTPGDGWQVDGAQQGTSCNDLMNRLNQLLERTVS